eukprot:scaffold1493_cov172-Ochromonas_danica.AAC.8
MVQRDSMTSLLLSLWLLYYLGLSTTCLAYNPFPIIQASREFFHSSSSILTTIALLTATGGGGGGRGDSSSFIPPANTASVTHASPSKTIIPSLVVTDSRPPTTTSTTTSTTITYRSGKSPEGLPSSKSDSKKDINFLRCISDCKSRCQLPGQGLAKTDCLQDCQDQCCTSYEQCSYKIKINSANSI